MKIFIVFILSIIVFSCQQKNSADGRESENPVSQDQPDTLRYEKEKYLRNVRQLTWGGNNAEAYWSFDGEQLVFQSDYPEWGVACDQIFMLNPAEATPEQKPKMVSTGMGRTTCSYFLPGDSLVVYGSTHLADVNCPETPPRSVDGKYVWPIYESYDIFVANLRGDIVQQLTDTPGYDAEATVSPNGDRIIFTSMRSGDLELYTMNIDGTDVKQITDELGYDGGAFFSPDGSKIVWRASRPETDEDVKVYKDLLAQGLVQPTEMELYVANADGTEARKITDLGKANWAPFFTPDGERILFASNHRSERRGFPFNLYLINLDGTGLEQVTFDDTFDSFPMFSPDGKYLVWSSNRFNGGNRDTNVFMAEWVY
jgi:dipeptidyl aminopeptidase/acylaminoacyl peptidase